MPLENIVRAVRAAIDREGGRLDVVMISGGEPTVHPQITEILRALAALPVTRVLLNTNGIRLASDSEFVAFLHEHRTRIEIYLQYDGQRADTHEYLRGQDLRAVKRQTLERLSAAAVFTTLVMVVTRQNHDLIGEVLDTALDTPFVGGVMFQPIFGSGRAPQFDPMDRVTTTGVLRAIESQCPRVEAEDLIALPCSHPDCCSIGYLLKGNDGKYRSLARLVGHEVLRRNLGVVGNTIAFADTLAIVRDALAGVMSESMTLSRPELVKHLATLCTACDFGGVAGLIGAAFRGGSSHDFVGNRVKRITIKHFMDADTLIAERLEQCCVHVGSAGNDPVRMPFCAARLFPKVRAKALEGATTRAEVAMYHGG